MYNCAKCVCIREILCRFRNLICNSNSLIPQVGVYFNPQIIYCGKKLLNEMEVFEGENIKIYTIRV